MVMASRRCFRAVVAPRPTAPGIRASRATFSTTPRHQFNPAARARTDGVFTELSDARVSIPWIQAFRARRAQEAASTSIKSGAPDAHEPDPHTTTPPPPDKAPPLTPKHMRDSHHTVLLPLLDQPFLSDTYLNSAGHIRLGTIFMDLDALSGIVAYKHTGPGVTTVTAALDRIVIARPLVDLCNLRYSGCVTYAAGRSSMEITCTVSKASPGDAVADEPGPKDDDVTVLDPADVLLTCTFTMVSLNPTTRRPVPIPAITPTTPHEHALFTRGAARSVAKKALARASLLTTPPDASEAALSHRLWHRALAYHDPGDARRPPASALSMAATRLQTASIMQPQYRNRHSFMIFGGFLLKATFELAFCCAASFAHARPVFLHADPCTFSEPVPVGSVLYLTAHVAYTDPPLIDDGHDDHDDDHGNSDGGGGRLAKTDAAPAVRHGQRATPPGQDDDRSSPTHEAATPAPSRRTRVHVRVDSKVRDVTHGAARPCGSFHYTFAVDAPAHVHVLPRAYGEHMMWIDARRRARAAKEMEREEARERARAAGGSVEATREERAGDAVLG